MKRPALLILVVTLTVGCTNRDPRGIEITSVEQLRNEIQTAGVDCDDLELIPAERYASESATCEPGLVLSILPGYVEMGPVLQAAHAASGTRTDADQSALAFGDTWLVSCDTDSEPCETISEYFSAGLSRQQP